MLVALTFVRVYIGPYVCAHNSALYYDRLNQLNAQYVYYFRSAILDSSRQCGAVLQFSSASVRPQNNEILRDFSRALGLQHRGVGVTLNLASHAGPSSCETRRRDFTYNLLLNTVASVGSILSQI